MTLHRLPLRSPSPLLRSRLISVVGALIGAVAIVATASAAPGSAPAKKPDPKKAAPKTGYSGSVHHYDIPLLADGTSFNQPTNQWSYYFEVRPGVTLVDGAYVDLNYLCSSTLLVGQGSITLLLNNRPIESHLLPSPNSRSGSWRAKIPLSLFKRGFNELRIISRQRSSDGECRDLDNMANWIRFTEGCKLHLVRTDPPVFPLYAYPFPFLDTLATDPVASTWVISNPSSKSQVAQALTLASDWGREEPVRGLNIRLTGTRGAKGQAIYLDDSSGGSSTIRSTPGSGPGASRLQISGSGDKGLRSAIKALAYPEMVAQFQGTQQEVTTDPVDEPRTPTTRLGSFSFTELGFPAISMNGAYHQKVTLTIQRPIRVDLGRESFIKIHFRHSASLNPLRSSLTVRINNLEIGSDKLEPDNANAGVITARIPVTELAKNLWQIELLAYHDLATVDCSKSYDDVAWTVIEGISSLELNTGQLGGRPYLDAFPYLVGRDGVAPKTCTISFSQTPSDSQLSLAATVAGRAAQMNRHSFDWNVSFGDLPQSDNSSIAIGYYDEASRFSNVANKLLVAPLGGGRFKIDSRLRLLDSALAGGAVIQAVRSPWNDKAVLYVVLGADDAALGRLTRFLADGKRVVDLTNEVALLKRDGTLVTLSTIGPNDQKGEQQRERESYTPLMRMAATIIGALIVAGLLIVLRQFVRKTPAHTTKTSV